MILSGSCNRCGACCTLEVGPSLFRCERLNHDSSCAVYESRTNLMSIVIISASGERRAARCGKDSPLETRAIMRVIERCSMRTS